ncbi:DUF2971 domain-containing protein [Stenotrophomonas acidaminiphila]|uniref:DUF2971 domain-containing protein n=1 Tax=Stenotrophomonas acidaminiphila TaxID=128780 RepID=UPI000CDBC571|nr:DUF2971 domain-containing protein [Stenotrophomonas acidaminiphila]AUZ56598.1 hypothetical protein B1L07_12825 [Stenotrophomonas acidaminiphila]
MLLYYFVNQEFGLKDLRERRLKISDIANLNDPFDFLSVAAPSREGRKMLREWRQSIANDIGLICFSRNWHSPVQWAHYADRHKGVCLGFEVDDSHLHQVNYVQSRPAWPATPQPWPTSVKQQIIDQLLYTKFSHWSYEDEYRLFISKTSPDPDGNFYANFSDDLKLQKILVGACSTLTRSDLNSALGSLVNDVESFKVRLAFRDFRIVKQRKASEWR